MSLQAGFHVEHRGSFDLPFAAEQSFGLFSPAGERFWGPGWTPTYLYPAKECWQEGMVFRTAVDGEETLWMLPTLDRVDLRLEYVRIVPNSRIGYVRLRCSGKPDGSSEVKISYELTAVSEAGAVTLHAFNDEAFAELLRSWRDRILSAFE